MIVYPTKNMGEGLDRYPELAKTEWNSYCYGENPEDRIFTCRHASNKNNIKIFF